MRLLALLAGLALVGSGCVAVPPPVPVVTQATMAVSPGNPACRDYTAQAVIDGSTQTLIGHACQQADGSWRVIEGTPEQPQQFVAVYPAAFYPVYPYDPWFWGPPIGLSVGAFVFVDRGHHFHDFGRFHHRFALGGFHHDGFHHDGSAHGGFLHGGWGGMRGGRMGRG
jgi:hypothetical protein